MTETSTAACDRHTPGPWRVEQDTTLVWGSCNADDTSSRGMGYPITECRISPCSGWAKGPGPDEGEANACLIAAAPNLLTVARMAAAQFDFYAEQHAAKGTPEADVKAQVNRAKAAECRAAIALAGAAR